MSRLQYYLPSGGAAAAALVASHGSYSVEISLRHALWYFHGKLDFDLRRFIIVAPHPHPLPAPHFTHIQLALLILIPLLLFHWWLLLLLLRVE